MWSSPGVIGLFSINVSLTRREPFPKLNVLYCPFRALTPHRSAGDNGKRGRIDLLAIDRRTLAVSMPIIVCLFRDTPPVDFLRKAFGIR
jgi:hypothetical protein